MSVIEGKEYLLRDIFSNLFEYRIPIYQRPYSWKEKQVTDLFDDLFDFYDAKNANGAYFLGSLVLVEKSVPYKYFDVTDGQQRLITLTILLASISAYLDDAYQSSCYGLIWNKENSYLDPPSPSPRLYIRDEDKIFFKDNIQKILPGKEKLEAMEKFVADKYTVENESRTNIRENCGILLQKIQENFSDAAEVYDFLKCIRDNCYLVVVKTVDEEIAFKVFQILNTRGLNLSPSDIIKADLLKDISTDREDYADKWEELEIKATQQGFNDVFTHLRMVYLKKKAQKSILDEFKKEVFPKINLTPEKFIDEILTPYTKCYVEIKNMSYPNPDNSAKVDEINFLLMWLNKVDNFDWIAPTLKFFVDRHNDVDYILWFTKKMERLAAFMYIKGYNVNKRIDRYAKIISEMENNPSHNLNAPLKEIELTDAEKTEFMNALNGEIYDMMARRRNYVILRLDSFVAAGATPDYNPHILSIEHVLPQTIEAGSQWEAWWPNAKDRTLWQHRIANLVPLTRRKNSAAQNFDFDKKKKEYFTGKNGTISYPLTSQVVHENTWTPAVVSARQKNLLEVFKTNWEL